MIFVGGFKKKEDRVDSLNMQIFSSDFFYYIVKKHLLQRKKIFFFFSKLYRESLKKEIQGEDRGTGL